ncbi:MAG: polyphosphate kinase 1, partial [Defluviitaleaceae bacterium]|nr:polyphosphate kinase 1 [Defluviitaleaceae bacterium]
MNDKTDYFFNRELSWLQFNERVLQEANRADTPVLEKLKFISIFTSNLDEFFMVRVGALTDYVHVDDKYKDNKTGMNAQEQLNEIFRAVTPLYTLREQTFSSVIKKLAHYDVHLLKMNELDANDLKNLKKYFLQNVLPLLSPQIISSRHPFPHLSNKQIHIAVKLEKKRNALFGLVAMPQEKERLVFLELGGSRFVLLEDLIFHFAELVFNIYTVTEKNIIAVTRNADIDTEEYLHDEEDFDYRMHMKNILKKRRRLSPVRLEMVFPASTELLEFLCEKLSLETQRVFYSDAPLDLSFCFSLDRYMRKEIVRRIAWPAHSPAEVFSYDEKRNMIKLVLSGRDLLLSYPFDSMSPFLLLLRQAAEDSFVVSIKITLYRVDVKSKLAESLILAAENGKEVIVLMELRARFDEKNNIDWAHQLEEAGCRVVYGLIDYKVHSKVCLITRREYGKIQYIAQIGTGNFNEKTSKLYTDLSLITANKD